MENNQKEFICLVCNCSFTHGKFYRHLKKHGLNLKTYLEKYPDSEVPKGTSPSKESLIKKNGVEWWEEREKKRKHCSSLPGYIEKYGKEEGIKKYEKRYKKVSKSLTGKKYGLDFFINKYGEKEGPIKFKQKGKNISKGKKEKKCGTIEWYINKYDFEEGLIQYDLYIKKLKERHTLESLIKKHGIEEGIRRFDQFLEKSKVSLENFIKRYGEEIGNRRWNEYKEKLRNNNYFCFGWWLKKYNNNIELATIKYKEFQTRDVGWFIKKYGELEGKQRYNEWVAASRNSTGYFSKISQELFRCIDEILMIKNPDEICFYHDKNEEKQIFKFKVDFLFRNKVIEFYGNYYHMNPKIFKACDYNDLVKLTSEEIWKKDEERINIITNEGYECLIIWEIDFWKNKKKTINDCLKFLEGENQ